MAEDKNNKVENEETSSSESSSEESSPQSFIWIKPESKQDDVILFKEISNVKMNLLKEILESAGVFFGSGVFAQYKQIINVPKELLSLYKPKNANIVRYNNKITNDATPIIQSILLNPDKFGLSFGGDMKVAFGDLYELCEKMCEPYLKGALFERAKETIKLLMELGLSKQTACAAVGVFLSENHCEPSNICQKEADGGGTKYTQGGGYGAGIASWTGVEYKAQCLKLIGKPAGTKIEDLSLKEQCEMYVKELIQSKSNKTVNKLLNGNIEECTVAAAFKTHGDNRPETLGKYGYTYKAIYEEQLLQTERLMRFAHVSKPSDYHKTALCGRVMLGSKLLEKLNELDKDKNKNKK